MIIINSLDVSTHSTLLTVEYDDYIPENTSDGEDEVWYYLCENNYSRVLNFDYYHIEQNSSTIKYYFEEDACNGSGYTWTTDIDEEQANKI